MSSLANSLTVAETDGQRGLFGLLAGFLIFAPLIKGGNWPLSLLILELGTLGLGAYLLRHPAFRNHLSGTFQLTLAVLLLLPALQLLPLPAELWIELPGRQLYAQGLEIIDESTNSGSRPVSIVPLETESAWLTLLPPLVLFLAAIGLTTRQLQTLVILFLGLAAFQATLGLIQYGDGPDSPFRLGNPHMGDSASGTYINRNHLAGFLAMALPVGLALLAATVGYARRRSQKRRKRRLLRDRVAELGSLRANQALLYGAASLVILLGLIFTRSRAGVGLGMLAILLCTLMFSRRLGGKNVYGLMGTFTAIGIGLASLIGLVPVLARFTQDPLADSRWTIFSSTLQAIGRFFPLGSGGGTFLEVFRGYHPPEIEFAGVVNHAHNDYLEWTLEGGLPVIVLLAILLVFYLRQWSWLRYRGVWSTFRFVQVGAGIGLLLMLLHSLVDFNLHIPANAIFFAFLAAVFFHRHQEEEKMESRPERVKQKHETNEVITLSSRQEIPPENKINPFDAVP